MCNSHEQSPAQCSNEELLMNRRQFAACSLAATAGVALNPWRSAAANPISYKSDARVRT